MTKYGDHQIGAELPGVEGDPRLTAIYLSIVEKMKEVVREFAITQEELHVAGDYLNRLGQSGFCRSLIDVNLAMTSVDVTARVDGGTRPNLKGPFHKTTAPLRPDGDLFDVPPPPGSPVLILEGVVTHAETGAPIAGAEVDLWQADHEGHYDRTHHHLSGVVRTDAEGRYRARTAVPRDYSDHDHDPIGELFRAMGRHNRRAAHIHMMVRVDGETLLVTQLFIPGNPYLKSDYVEGAVSEDLILDFEPVAGADNHFHARFDVAVAPRVAVTEA
jgi:catechol 1,2-dioxygenase